ncbi:MAG TPA: metal ABC transporter permease [Actinobacteria bacterium]|nr:metal ABC transporter permease [Actinomycetota bacterium]
MKNAILAAAFAGISCSLLGVFVVTMKISFIGVCMSHAAFAGAILGVLLSVNPILMAFLFCAISAAIIGPLSDRGELFPDASLGIIFSLMLGLAFLFMGLLSGPKTQALGLIWGSILTVTKNNVWLLFGLTMLVILAIVSFYKEIQAVIFDRELALAAGVSATAIIYGLYFLTGATITASFSIVGGLLIFSLIINPAAAAYQLTYSLKKMFLLSALFGVFSGWAGLAISYLFNLPSGASIIIISSLIFAAAAIYSPKRRKSCCCNKTGEE